MQYTECEFFCIPCYVCEQKIDEQEEREKEEQDLRGEEE